MWHSHVTSSKCPEQIFIYNKISLYLQNQNRRMKLRYEIRYSISATDYTAITGDLELIK